MRDYRAEGYFCLVVDLTWCTRRFLKGFGCSFYVGWDLAILAEGDRVSVFYCVQLLEGGVVLFYFWGNLGLDSGVVLRDIRNLSGVWRGGAV